MREKKRISMIFIAFLSVALMSHRGSMAYDWTIEVVDNNGTVGTFPSLCFDGSGNLYISYSDDGNDNLKVATLIDTVWNIEMVDSAGYVGKYSTIEIDSLGNKNIAYYNESVGAVKYAGWIEPAFRWDYQTVDGVATIIYKSCMTLNPAGYVELCYYNLNRSDLIHAVQDSAGWQTQTIDSVGNVGKFSSLFLDSAGRRCWSYYDESYGALKYAGWKDPLFDWGLEIADNISTSGYTIDMIFNLSGNVEMSYYSSGNGDLKHVVRSGSGWDAQVVDSVGNVGMYSSLVMDSSGNRGISYYDAGLFQLKYAGKQAPKYDWILEVVDNNGNVGTFPSICFDSLGFPAVSYYDAGNGNLKFAVRDSVSWNCQVVDSTGDVGKFSSLVFDTNEPKWAISYYDETDFDLKYAESTLIVVPIPALSEWGLLVLALLLLAAGTVAVVRRRKSAEYANTT